MAHDRQGRDTLSEPHLVRQEESPSQIYSCALFFSLRVGVQILCIFVLSLALLPQILRNVKLATIYDTLGCIVICLALERTQLLQQPCQMDIVVFIISNIQSFCGNCEG